MLIINIVIDCKGACLDNKLLIVDRFLQLLNSNQLAKIVDSVSDDFEFISSIRGNIGFGEYCQYVTYNSDCVEMQIREREPDGDKINVYLDISIIDNTLKYYSELNAIATFEFDNHLLKRLSIKYQATEADMVYMKNFVSIQYGQDSEIYAQNSRIQSQS